MGSCTIITRNSEEFTGGGKSLNPYFCWGWKQSGLSACGFKNDPPSNAPFISEMTPPKKKTKTNKQTSPIVQRPRGDSANRRTTNQERQLHFMSRCDVPRHVDRLKTNIYPGQVKNLSTSLLRRRPRLFTIYNRKFRLESKWCKTFQVVPV